MRQGIQPSYIIHHLSRVLERNRNQTKRNEPEQIRTTAIEWTEIYASEWKEMNQNNDMTNAHKLAVHLRYKKRY